ncbi:hypothetical protein GCM10009411_05650 [Shewanella litoralis]|uniref:Transposase DDE domain-containing protein n=1 Tax=Shewanella litoralis TaxID=2282700 RepID=A0ABQ2R0N2_9GAMM|nr:hypothetical protein GCM10009411_05650 [Shewanella litoralis]
MSYLTPKYSGKCVSTIKFASLIIVANNVFNAVCDVQKIGKLIINLYYKILVNYNHIVNQL